MCIRDRHYAAEFPSDELIQMHVADTLCRMHMWEDRPSLDALEEAEKLYLTLADTTQDDEFRYEVLESLAALYAVGYKMCIRDRCSNHRLSPALFTFVLDSEEEQAHYGHYSEKERKKRNHASVSYTHLDVYKRQCRYLPSSSSKSCAAASAGICSTRLRPHFVWHMSFFPKQWKNSPGRSPISAPMSSD